MTGRRVVDVPYRGVGLSNTADAYEGALHYETDDTTSALTEFLEMRRAEGGVHDFAFWVPTLCVYAIAAGQSIFYLPRGDAFAKSYPGYTDASYSAVARLNDAALSVVYQSTVTIDSDVPSGEVWISRVTTLHPDAGTTVALCKLGNPPSVAATLIVKYVPLFRVVVTGLPTEYPHVGREDKTLYLVEVN
jgi:hypothetical protein